MISLYENRTIYKHNPVCYDRIKFTSRDGDTMKIEPNYQYFVKAMKNETPERMPIYEHHIDAPFMEKATGQELCRLLDGTTAEKKLFFSRYIGFWRDHGYDIVSFERGIPQSMPGSGSLRGHVPGVIRTRADYDNYPWDKIPDWYFEQNGAYFELLAESMPENMRAVGGPGYGVFESVEDITGYMDLCYLSDDDPELYADLFKAVGDVYRKIWQRFAKDYSAAYCVFRMGDDLGFQTNTLISYHDIRTHVLPVYRDIVEIAHRAGRPFLLHSCGKIFPVMEDIIATGIDGKHSNEDAIAPFSTWVNLYGDRICNLGGIDMNVLCLKTEAEIREIVFRTIEESVGHGGFALGSGNSIPDYVPVEGFLAMNRAANEFRLSQMHAV